MKITHDLLSMSIGKKVGLLMISAILGVLILAATVMLSERNLIMAKRSSSVRQAVETAHGVIGHFQHLASKGAMPEAGARQRAIATVKALRYNGAEYFFITDMQSRGIMHPIKPELDGKDLADIKDPTGKSLFADITATVQQKGAGFGRVRRYGRGDVFRASWLSRCRGIAVDGRVAGRGSGGHALDIAAAATRIDDRKNGRLGRPEQ